MKTSFTWGLLGLLALGAHAEVDMGRDNSAALPAVPAPRARTAAELKVMSYNVQNLFDTVDSPNTNDSEFTPGGDQQWSDTVVRDKIQNLGTVIRSESPDFIGLYEIENFAMIERLVREGLPRQGYVVWGSGPSDDARGIRNGFISRFPVVDVRSHRVWREAWQRQGQPSKRTRDILEVTVRVPARRNATAQDVTFFLNHWPSRGGGADAVSFRQDVAAQLATFTEAVTTAHPNRLVVSMGDYNDELGDPPFTATIRMAASVAELARLPAPAFFAIDSLLPLGSGTFYYFVDRVWNSLDHILMAGGRGYLNGRTPAYRFKAGSEKIVRSSFVSNDAVHSPQGCEIRRGGRRSQLGCPRGASDHFPLSAVFEYR